MYAGQSKLHSMIEIVVSYIIGFAIAFFTQYLLLNALGFHASAKESFWITVVFTIISMIRSYFVRRMFNWFHVKGWL